jgi:hypothetical protein
MHAGQRCKRTARRLRDGFCQPLAGVQQRHDLDAEGDSEAKQPGGCIAEAWGALLFGGRV